MDCPSCGEEMRQGDRDSVHVCDNEDCGLRAVSDYLKQRWS